MEAGSARLLVLRHNLTITNPRIISDPHHKDLPFIVRHILKLIHIEEEMRVDATG